MAIMSFQVNISKISKTYQPKPTTKGFLSVAKYYGKKLAKCMNALPLKDFSE